MEKDNPDITERVPRKMRFRPKIPVCKAPKLAQPQTNISPEAEAAQRKEVMRLVNENLGIGRSKSEKKSATVEIETTQKGTSTPMRSYGESSSRSSESKSRGLPASGGYAGDPSQRSKFEHRDPCSYSPITLPLRKLNSGDPNILDEEEFGEAAAEEEYDETKINAAAKLGLMDESDETKMVFFQLPNLPAIKRSTDSSSLEDLTPGFMGKMLVYESGAVKLKLGDKLFDVFPGSDVCAENVAAINTKERSCNIVGDVVKHAVVTPDIDSLLR